MLFSFVFSLLAPGVVNLDSDLVGHWKLETDCLDSSGMENHGENRGVRFEEAKEGSGKKAAFFDGRQSRILVPHADCLRFGSGDFTVALWIKTEEDLDDILGDLVTKFDPRTRRGFNLGILCNAGVASSQANDRNLFFGIDSGKVDSEWRDCGRPGNNLMVWSLAVFQGDLYAGTFESGENDSGHVYRYAGETEWVECGAPYKSNAVTSLAVYKGSLYAAASHYRSSGSALAESENTTPGGRIFRYAGGTDWVDCGELENPEGIFGLVVFAGKLYATSMYSPGLFRYDGNRRWTPCGNLSGRVCPVGVYNGHLYAGSYDMSGVLRYSSEGIWEDLGNPEGVTQVYSFAAHDGDLYTGTWPDGTVFRYQGPNDWVSAGRLGEEKEVMGMAVYNGKLYAGTLPLAKVYRYDGETTWTDTGQLDKTPDVKYRRAWTMAVCGGRLFCGTLPSGHVYSLEAGKAVTYDQTLQPGWHHLAAIRKGGSLRLYLDGEIVSESTAFQSSDFDLSNERPLEIGSGPQDRFNGRMRDLRVYRRCLGVDEIGALSGE